MYIVWASFRNASETTSITDYFTHRFQLSIHTLY